MSIRSPPSGRATRALWTSFARAATLKSPPFLAYVPPRPPNVGTLQLAKVLLSRSQNTVANTTIHPERTDRSVPPRIRSRPVPVLRLVLIAGLSFALGVAMSAAPVATVTNGLISPPTDTQTLSLWQPKTGTREAEIEAQLQAHPAIAILRADSGLMESRPHMRIPAQLRTNNLTAGTLLTTDALCVPALAFAAPDGSRMVSVHYVGSALCGHPGVVHGGLLATLLDEGLARCCFPALPNRIGMTASLVITYKAPCRADQFIVLRAETTRVEGRKAWVTGRLETLVNEANGEKPLVLDEAEALFIEPRQAAALAKVYNPNS